jgi:hypothetical protein
MMNPKSLQLRQLIQAALPYVGMAAMADAGNDDCIDAGKQVASRVSVGHGFDPHSS